MHRHAFAREHTCSRVAQRCLPTLLLVALASATPAAAQSFLGTVRGTVTDAQGAVVSGASVLIIDEDSGATRTIDTDAEGRYEAARLRPGTYRVEVVAPSFKKFEKTGIVLRAAGTALVDIALEVGALAETVTVSAETENNITLESQAIARGLDEQQLRDLPRNSRDIQDFLMLNPNVVGGFDDIQFLGGRTYGVSYIQDGQPSTNAHLRHDRQRRARPRRRRRDAGALELVQRRVRRPRRRRRDDEARRQPVPRHRLLRLQHRRLNALTYAQTLAGVERGDPNADTHEHRWGVSLGGPIVAQQDVLLRQLRGSERQGDSAAARSNRADRGDAQRRLLAAPASSSDDPADRPAVPRQQMIPANGIDPAARNDHGLLLPAAQPGHARQRVRACSSRSCPRRATATAPTSASITSRRRTTRSSSAGSWQHRDPSASRSRCAATAFTNLPHREHEPRHRLGDRRVDEDLLSRGRQRVPRRLQLRQLEPAKAHSAPATCRPSSASRRRPVSPTCAASRSFMFSGANRPAEHRDQRRNVDRTLRQNAFSISDNFTWLTGGHSLEGGRHLHPQHRRATATGRA